MTNAAHPYRQMALNNAWANATLYRVLADLPDGAFVAQRPGFFGSLAATLNHIHQVDLYYIDALEEGGQGRTIYARPELDDPRALATAQADADLRLAKFCAALSPQTLSAVRQTERKDGRATERVDALLLHLFQHQIHHRGQAHTQVHHAGLTPPQLDDFHLDYGRVPSAQAYFM